MDNMVASSCGNVNIITDNVSSDAITLGGVLPDTAVADWNNLMSVSAIFEDGYPIVHWDEEGDPSVELKWGPEDKFLQYFTKNEIYRSTTPDVDNTSELIATFNDWDTMSYADETIDPDEDIYYYRIYSYYDFGQDGTAQTYSSVVKAVLRTYVDINVPFENTAGTKEEPIKCLGVAVKKKVSNGTKICVAQGTYNESSKTMWLGRYDGLILEGGYESVNWTRDIDANETIIDGTSLEYSTIGLYNANGAVIDGFTITGTDISSGSWMPSAVDVNNSSDVTVKNCKIKNNYGAGIFIGNNSTAQIENNTIEYNNREGITIYYADSGISIIGNTILGNGHYPTNDRESGIIINYTPSVEIKDNTIQDSGKHGIQMWGDSYATISNNLIIKNAGYGIRAGSGNPTVIEHNTLAGNRGAVGIEYSTSLIEITDNIVYNTEITSVYGISGVGTYPTALTNNDVYGFTYNYRNCGTDAGDRGNISQDPLFTSGPMGDYYLSQINAGQAVNSPCRDVGSDLASNLGFTEDYTTRTDGGEDQGAVDLGFHYYLGGNIAPTAVIDSVSPNPAREGITVTLQGHGEDQDGDIIEYNWRSDIDGDIGTTQDLSISTLSSGTHTIHYKVRDNVGVWSEEVDTTVNIRGVSMTYPEDGDTVEGEVTVQAQLSHPSQAYYAYLIVDGRYYTYDRTSPYEFTWNTAYYEDGSEHTLKVCALYRDPYERIETEEVTVTASNPNPIIPSLEVVDPTPSGQTSVSGTVTVDVNGVDTESCYWVYLYCDNSFIGVDRSEPLQYSLDTTRFSNGTHQLKAYAYHKYLRRWIVSDPVSVNVDNATQNIPTIEFTNPTDGATISGDVTLTAEVSHPAQMTQNRVVYFYLDNRYIGYAWSRGQAEVQRLFRTGYYDNGSYTLKVIAYYSDGITRIRCEDTVDVTIDNPEPLPEPDVGITSPANGSQVSGTVNIAAEVNNTDTRWLVCYIDGRYLRYDSSRPFRFSWDTTRYSNGTHTIKVLGYHSPSGRYYTKEISVEVNN